MQSPWMLHTMLLKHPSTEIFITCITFVILCYSFAAGIEKLHTIDCQERSNLNTLVIIKLRPIYLYIYTFLFYLVGVYCTLKQLNTVQSLSIRQSSEIGNIFSIHIHIIYNFYCDQTNSILFGSSVSIIPIMLTNSRRVPYYDVCGLSDMGVYQKHFLFYTYLYFIMQCILLYLG